MMQKLLICAFLFAGIVSLVSGQSRLERPNIEAAQRALQERYLSFRAAAEMLNINVSSIPTHITFPVRKKDGKEPGLFPEDCFYEEDLVNQETLELKTSSIRFHILRLKEDMEIVEDWGQYWVHPSWHNAIDSQDSTDGSSISDYIRPVLSMEDYYPGFLSVSNSNYLSVFSTVVKMLEEMQVMQLEITNSSGTTQKGTDTSFVSCADSQDQAMSDHSNSFDSRIPTRPGYSEYRRTQIETIGNQDPKQSWYSNIRSREGLYAFDSSAFAEWGGRIEVFDSLAGSFTSSFWNVQPLTTAPHNQYDQWFSIDSVSVGENYVSETFVDHDTVAFTLGCPSLSNPIATYWSLRAKAVIYPEYKEFATLDLTSCTEGCDSCAGEAGVCSELEFGSLDFRMGIGRSNEGSAGSLRIYTQTISELTTSVFDLQASISNGSAQILRDGAYDNAIRQILSDQVLVDIEVTDGNRGYTIRYYDVAQKGSIVDGFYQPSIANAFKTVTVSNPDAPTYDVSGTIDLIPATTPILSPAHGQAIGTFFFGYLDTSATQLPRASSQGQLRRDTAYVFYASDSDNIYLVENLGNSNFQSDPFVNADDTITYTVTSPFPIGGVDIVESTSSRSRTIEYFSDTMSLTDDHTITLIDNQDGKIRKHSSVLTNDPNNSDLFSTVISELDANDNVIKKTQTDYQVYSWNLPESEVREHQAEIIRVIEDPDGEARTTTYSYYDDRFMDGRNYDRLKSVEYPDGSWEAYQYDRDEFTTKVIRPYLDSPLSLVNAGNFVKTMDRGFITDADGDSEFDNIETIIELIDDVEVARSYEIDWSDFSTGLQMTSQIDAATPSAAWDASGNLRTDTWTYLNGEFNGEIARIKAIDGTLTTYDYVIDSVTGAKTTTVRTGEANVAGDAVIDGTQIETVVTAQGGQSSRITTDILTGITLSSELTPPGMFDVLGRANTVLYLDGTSMSNSWQDCCGIATVTDRTGLVSTTETEMDGTLESVESSGITMIYTDGYDTDGADGVIGFTRSTTVDGRGTGDDVLTLVQTYTPAGRLLASLDPRDGVTRLTTFAESLNGAGQWSRTTTLPNAATQSEVQHKDGSLFESSFDGVTRERYLYAVESDTHDGLTFNARTETRILVGDNDETTEWVKNYTDMLGRVYKTETPDPNGTTATYTTENFYNSLGQLVRTVDADGQQTLFAYNGEGQLEDTALDINKNGTIDYAGEDRITRTETVVLNDTVKGDIIRETLSTWETENLDQARVIQQSDTATNGLDSWTESYGQESHLNRIYSGGGIVIDAVTSPAGTTVTTTTTNGFVTSRITQNPTEGTLASVNYTPDGFDRVYQETDTLLNTTWIYTYYDNNQPHQTISPESESGAGDAQTTTNIYDVMGRLADVTLPDSSVQSRRYYPDGELKLAFGSQTYPVQYTYDRQRRQRTMTTWQDFDEASEIGVSGDATTTWSYNPLGSLQSKEDAATNVVNYTYTPAGRIASKTSSRNIITTYGYDPDTRDLLTTAYDDGITPSITYAYDRQGRSNEITDASGTRSLTFKDGQLTDEAYTLGALDGSILERELDTLNRLASLSVSSANGVVHQQSFAYDAASRLDTISSAEHSVAYTYHPAATLRQTQTFNNGTQDQLLVNRRYDNLNRLKSRESIITGSGTSEYGYAYNALNQRERSTHADGSYWEFAYDPLGQLQSSIHKNASDVPMPGRSYGYVFDDIGNRTQTTVNGRTATYTPDALNQYDQRQVPRAIDVRGDAVSAATITVNGNSSAQLGDYFHHALDLSASGNAATVESILVTASLPDGGDGNVPRIADAETSEFLPANPEIFTHDADGNLIDDGQWHYTWDAENRLIEMETLPAAYNAGVDRLKVEFAYDSLSRRFSKKTYQWSSLSSEFVLSSDTVFIYDGWNLVYELNSLSSGLQAAKSYTWGIDLSGSMQGAGGVGGLLMVTFAGDANYYPIFDGNGNVMQYIEADSGASVAEFEYNPFGELIKEIGSQKDAFNFRFSTKYQDAETGLLYYGYRYYNAGAGRWLSKDPLGELGGLNLYGFIDNSSVNNIDYLGYYKIGFLEFTDEGSFFGDLGSYFGSAAAGIGEGAVNIAYGFRGAAEGIGETAAVIFDPRTRNLVVADVKSLANALREDPCLAKELAKQLFNQAGETLTDPDKLAKAIANASAGGAIASATGAGATNALNKLLKLLPESATNKIGSETTTVSKFFPSNDGFLGSSQRTFLEQGQLIDRIGLDKGKFFSPAGTPIPNRALRPETEGGPLSTFRVLKPFEVNSGTIAPAFNRPGLGTQFQSPVSAEVLLKRGIIERVP